MAVKSKLVLARLIIASFILLCTVQALYWPIIPKPGLELAWWQVEWLAKTGYVLGLPVLILARRVGGQLLLVASVAWSVCVFFLSGPVFNWATKKNRVRV